MITTLRRAVYDKLITITELAGNVFFLEAPELVTLPYLVVSKVTGGYDRDTVNEFRFEYLQINGYGKSLQNLEVIERKIREALDRKQGDFDLADYYVIDIDIQLDRQAKFEDVFQFTQQYKFHLQKKQE